MSASAVKVGTVTAGSIETVSASSGWLPEKDGAVFSTGVGLHLMLRSSALEVTQFAQKLSSDPHISREAAEVVNGTVRRDAGDAARGRTRIKGCLGEEKIRRSGSRID